MKQDCEIISVNFFQDESSYLMLPRPHSALITQRFIPADVMPHIKRPPTMLKKEQKIKQRITAIEMGSFDEDDVKLLLIEIREKLKGETFLREICDFVAHSDRNKGICHKKVDVRYAKLKLVEENTKRTLTPDFIEKNKDKSERFFTDAMLNYIQAAKIEKELFELLILSGIDDIENELFLQYYKLNKNILAPIKTEQKNC